jgi:hypothetical protein
VGVGATAIGSPPGARSSWSVSIVIDVHPTRFAMCPASHIIDPDFSCGRQSNLSAGTRSGVFRTPAISWSNSGSNASLIAM